MLNATTLILGHAHPDVTDAVQEQAARGLSFSTPTDSQARLAKLIADRVPSIDTVRFANSGTEATLYAIRVARAFTGRHKIAKFEGAYHGTHEYVSVSYSPPLEALDPEGPTSIPEFPGMSPSLLEDVVVLPYHDLAESERIIRAYGHELACVIMEPVASSFGYLPGNVDFLRGIREVTQELDILLVYDEVQSLRVAPGGAQELFGVTPDVTAMGKIVGGGMPVGAFGGRADIMSLFDPTRGATVAHAGTFNANPMTMVAGEVTMSALTPEVYQRMSDLGDSLRGRLQAVFDELDVDAQVTGVTSLWGVHFTTEQIADYRSVQRADADMTTRLFTAMLNEGVLLQVRGGGALSALTTEAEVDTLIEAYRNAIPRVR
jgi:glutamate-1-semialdehyde 2,1-aminomutase